MNSSIQTDLDHNASLNDINPSAEELVAIEAESKNEDIYIVTTAQLKTLEDSYLIYCEEIKNYPILSDEEVIALSKAKDAGNEEAREKLINCNLRLVVSIANSFARRYSLNPSDLTQDGNIGLIKAVERYDYTTGCRFSTFATWWIRQTMQRGIYDTRRTVRLPVHANAKLAKILKTKDNFYMENGYEPSLEELSKILHLEVNDIVSILTSSSLISFETPVNTGDESDELGDFIADEEENVESTFEKNYLKEILPPIIEKALKNDERAISIIKERSGFNDGEIKTLEEIGEPLEITRERVRQIEKAAMRILQKNKMLRKLYEDFI